jgi:glycine cleavage system H protein
MQFPANLKYTKDHEWVDATSGTCKVGVTAYAVDQLGDIVHVDLPKVGDVFEAGGSFGTIESTKTVSDLYMPVAGKVVEVNSHLLDKPESLQENAYGDGWLVKLEVKAGSSTSHLMDAKAYESFVSENAD